MTNAFSTLAIPWIFDAEGGYVNVVGDKGGTTKYGISLRYLMDCPDGDIDRDGDVDNDDIRLLTRDDVIRLYQRDYWVVNGCEVFPPALGLCLFDAAVNHGGRVGRQLIQSGLGVKADGMFGPVTLEAVRVAENDKERRMQVITEYGAHRAIRFASIIRDDRSQQKFELGWLRRLMRLIRVSMEAA